MEQSKDTQFYLVDERILPEAIKKTIQVKNLLNSGEVKTIHQAVQMVNLSRSAYYKYKDRVEPFYEAIQGRVFSVSIMISHEAGVLSRVLQLIARENGSIITINQGIPLQDVANVTLSFETRHMKIGVEELLKRAGRVKGVKDIRLIGHE
ncbi:MAG: ACT domain-containing protein [Veillonellaceae bacterium]|nr:ACT domain-containing protein [Veillonellaceae bacterium]